uniref:MS161, putative HsdS of type I restriction-modification system n=1 Tax=Microscilla sp. PRE1 TaxID=155537 RepID=Q93P70_9BACT|nr:restriction endonuclease subunit S [Microscilla sp. PRE1]AAK62883.1 MS161, putative HsdS of type I restriction-modification system [Microscilla sp. PRE1]
MPQNWKKYKLENVSERVTVGFVGSMAQEYVDKGVPMLRSQNIKPFSLDFDNVKFISEKFHAKISKSSLKADDVAIVRTGTPGTACAIPERIGQMNCSDLVIVTPNLNLINPHFLCYYFYSIASHYVNSQLVGAVQQHFNVGSAKKMEILLPSLKEQDTIVDVLKSIIDKIELNLQMNRTLEEMAMTLYKHWFVDFGPFKSPLEGGDWKAGGVSAKDEIHLALAPASS